MKRSSSAGLGLLRSQGGSEKVPHLASVSLCGSSSVLVESDLSGFLPEKTPRGASVPPPTGVKCVRPECAAWAPEPGRTWAF